MGRVRRERVSQIEAGKREQQVRLAAVVLGDHVHVQRGGRTEFEEQAVVRRDAVAVGEPSVGSALAAVQRRLDRMRTPLARFNAAPARSAPLPRPCSRISFPLHAVSM